MELESSAGTTTVGLAIIGMLFMIVVHIMAWPYSGTQAKPGAASCSKHDLDALSRVLPSLVYQFVQHPSGKSYYAYANDAINDILGVRPEDAREDAAITFSRIHPDDLATVVESNEYSQRHLLIWDQEFRVCHPTKGVITVHSRSSPEILPDGSTMWTGYAVDVTKEKREQKELADAKSRFDLACRSLEIGVYDWDAHEDVLNWDEGMFALYGCAPRDFKHKYEDWASRVHPEDLEKTEALLLEQISSTSRFGPLSFRVTIRGEERWVQASGVAVLNDKGAIQRLAGINLDITESIVTERSLVEAKNAAEAAAKAKALFLAAMSHEIRTPLHGVLGMLTLLEESKLTGQQHEWACDARSSASNLLVLINDILDYSRLEASALPLDHKPFDPMETIRDIVTVFQPAIQEKDLMFELTEIQDGASKHERNMVMGDAARVRQIVLNYLSNALKFTRSGKISLNYIYTTTDSSHCVLRIEVCDTGIGISEHAESSLFQPFVQGDNSPTREFGGTGLGLAINKQLVERMGGQLGAHNNTSGGSTFWFEIPFERVIAHIKLPTKRAPTPDPSYDMSGPIDLQDVKVLLAEDSRINQKLVKAYLASSRCQLDVVENGVEAVEAVRGGNYDIVLMDIQMPEMDGVTATHCIKAMQANLRRRCPYVIALTANALTGDRERFLEAGMDEYVSKPVSKQLLLHKMLTAYQSMQATCG